MYMVISTNFTILIGRIMENQVHGGMITDAGTAAVTG